MPRELYQACGLAKKAAVLVCRADGRLDDWKAAAIIRVADEVIAGELDEHFPCSSGRPAPRPRAT